LTKHLQTPEQVLYILFCHGQYLQTFGSIRITCGTGHFVFITPWSSASNDDLVVNGQDYANLSSLRLTTHSIVSFLRIAPLVSTTFPIIIWVCLKPWILPYFPNIFYKSISRFFIFGNMSKPTVFFKIINKNAFYPKLQIMPEFCELTTREVHCKPEREVQKFLRIW